MLTEEQRDLVENHFQVVEIVVDKILRQSDYRQYKPWRDELIGEGTMALVNSATTFDKTRGVKFITYCNHNIYHLVKNYIKRILLKECVPLCYIDNMVSVEYLLTTETEEEENSNDIKIDWGEYEPEDEKNKAIFYRCLLGGEPHRKVAADLNICYNNFIRRKKKIIATLQKQLIGEN